MRAAVYQSSPAGARLAAHGRCADALAAQGAPATSRAHHVEQAARRGAPGRASGGDLEALSGRELEVAPPGRRPAHNPEIAADLFLSLKTVESHMRNIFRKLDVTSRVEVARMAKRASPA